jgi:endonuclease III
MINKTTEPTGALDLAKDAINYALERIRDDADIRYHMGAFTEAFEKLKAAHSALTGISPEAIEEEIFSKKLKRQAAAQIIDELKKLVDEYNNSYDDKPELITKIKALIY